MKSKDIHAEIREEITREFQKAHRRARMERDAYLVTHQRHMRQWEHRVRDENGGGFVDPDLPRPFVPITNVGEAWAEIERQGGVV